MEISVLISIEIAGKNPNELLKKFKRSCQRHYPKILRSQIICWWIFPINFHENFRGEVSRRSSMKFAKENTEGISKGNAKENQNEIAEGFSKDMSKHFLQELNEIIL